MEKGLVVREMWHGQIVTWIGGMMFSFFRKKVRAETRRLIEIDSKSPPEPGMVAHWLTTGHVLIFRGVPEIHRIRDQLLACSERLGGRGDGRVSAELIRWLDHEETPSIETVHAFSQAVKVARNTRYLPYITEKFVNTLGLPEPARIHHGMPRVIFPPELVGQARLSGLFEEEDFKRKDADGYGEFFMPGPSNIHRDFNRWHGVLMCNLWFTMHDAGPDEVVRIWPQKYSTGMTDQDNTLENSNRLAAPLEFHLKTGDAVLFHSEQLHASPEVGHDRRRFSFDMRIAADSRDDNAHYRRDFWDVRDFVSEDKADLYAWTQAEKAVLKASEMCAIYWLNKLESELQAMGPHIEALKSAMEQMNYAEDFLNAIARLVYGIDRDFSDGCLEKVVKQSNLPFFILDAAKELAAHGKVFEARVGLEKVVKLKGGSLPDYTPMIYDNKQVTQMRPEDMVLQAREFLKGLPIS